MTPAAFTICYSFEGSRFVFSYLSSRLTDTDACYLSLLHAGCIPEQGMACRRVFGSMQDFAGRSGVTEVRWHKSDEPGPATTERSGQDASHTLTTLASAVIMFA